MNLIPQRKDNKLQALTEKASALGNDCDRILFELERDEKLLDRYESKDFEWFVKEILSPELDRIAHKQMAVDVDDRDNRLRAEGAYDKMKILSRGKEHIEEDIDFNRQELARKRDDLTSANQQINKMKE